MRTSTILRAVKRRLPKDADTRGTSPFICDQVREVCEDMGKRLTGVRIRNMISKRINGRFDIEAWLIHEAGVHPAAIDDINIQEYRQRWLDSMIVEFTAKGD